MLNTNNTYEDIQKTVKDIGSSESSIKKALQTFGYKGFPKAGLDDVGKSKLVARILDIEKNEAELISLENTRGTSLKQRLLEKEFGDHAAAIEGNTVYCPSGCGEDIEVNSDVDKVYLDLMKGLLGRKFLFNGRSKGYTRNQLAEKLVELDVATNVHEANGFVPELLKIRRAKNGHGYRFETKFNGKQEPLYFAVKESVGY